MSDDRQNTMDAMLKGALAGLAGGVALLAAERMEREMLLPTGASNAGTAQRAVESLAAEHGTDLPEPAAMAAGAGAQLGWCALWGAVYGVVHNRLDTPAVVDALVLAGAAYYAARSKQGVLPRLGLAAPVTSQNMEQTAVDVVSHLAFGITTATVFEAAA
jgi:hypothetical protein